VSDPFSILELRRESGARARRLRRWRLSLVIGALLLVVLGLAGVAFIAPPFVKRQLEHRLADALHREATIRDLHLNPFDLSMTVDGLAINDRDGRLLFGCERLYVKFGLGSFFSGQWIFKEISLMAPVARLEIGRDGALNIADLLAPSAENYAAPGKPGPIRIGRLTVAQARFTFDDYSHAQDFSTELGPLDFSLEDFSTVPVAPGAPYEFTASSESGESLHWRGTLSADPLRSIGGFALGQIALKKYAPYFAGLVRGDVMAGTLDAAGRYEIDLSARPCVIKIADGELHLHGLQLAPHSVATPVVDLPVVDLTGLGVSLAPLKVSAAKLSIAGGNIALQRGADGTLNLAEIFASPAGSQPSSGAPDAALAAFEIHGLALTFDDATTPHPAHNAIASLDFSAQEISLAPGAPPAPLELAVRFSPQGVMALKGSFALAPRRADLGVELADFPLAGIAPYLEPLRNLRFTEGTVSAHGQLTFAAAAPVGSPPQITFHGDAELDRVAMVEGGSGEDFASFASLGLKQIDFSSTPLAVAMAEVSFIEPSFHFTLYRDGSTNLALVRPSRQPGLPVMSDASPPGRKISVGHIALADGAFIFTDCSIEPNINITVNQIAGFIAGLSSDNSARAAIDLSGKVDNSEPVAIAGQIGTGDGDDAFADLTAGCDNIDLQPAGPYFGKYAGYTLGRGSLSLDLKVHLEQSHLDSQNVVTLNQFTLGEKTSSPDATSLPVRFAIALLKDARGKIVVDLPVQGSLDDSRFRIGDVVFQAITNLLVKATTAPFALLGSKFGGANQPLDHVDFAPGASELAAKEMKKLDVIARALIARPSLTLDVAGDADINDDMSSLQRRKLVQLLRARIWESRHNADPGLPPIDQIEISRDELDRALVSFYSWTFAPGAGPGAGKTPVAHTQEGPLVFPRNPNSFNGLTTRLASPAETGPQAGPPNSPPVAMPSLQDMVARLAARQRVGDSDIGQLAADRAQHVKDYLLAQGVPAERVLSDNSVAGSAPRVTLQLK
jgi:hypothetical protein